MNSKFSHFAAVGLLVVAGFALSLGVEGRSQVVAMSETVTEIFVGAIADVGSRIGAAAQAFESLSFATVYGAVGEWLGAVDVTLPSASAAMVPQALAVTKSLDPLSDAEQRARIEASFSDTVKVVPDATKTSGTITPVFRGEEGEEYLYVVVPMKK